ncbi:MAG: acyltransferase [Candidatus Helarchaeota archaeon]
MTGEPKNNEELHFKISDLNLRIYIPIHFFIVLTPIYPVFYLLLIYLKVFNYNLQIGLIFLPLVILGLTFLYIVLVVYLTKFVLVLSHWRSKPREGENMERDFNSRLVFHYHLRGFVKKFPLWLILRSPFHFLVPWMFKTFGLYSIGKNVLIYDSWIGLEFIYLEDNTIVGIGSVLSSHLVDGMNRLTIKKIKLGKNSQLGHDVLLAPGVELGEYAIIRSRAGVPKLEKLKTATVYKSGFDNSLYKRDVKGTKILRSRLEMTRKNGISKAT